MFTKKPLHPLAGPAKSGVPSVISSDMNILGNIISDGQVEMDGVIEGNIKCHSVTVRPNGKVRGDIVAEQVHVYGAVQGIIKGAHVHLFPGCKVQGVIMHQSLAIDDGAMVDGKFKRTDAMFMTEVGASLGIEEDNVTVLDHARLLAERGKF